MKRREKNTLKWRKEDWESDMQRDRDGGGGRDTVLLGEGVASEGGWCPEL